MVLPVQIALLKIANDIANDFKKNWIYRRPTPPLPMPSSACIPHPDQSALNNRVEQLEDEAEASKKTEKAALSALGQERATAQIAAQQAQIDKILEINQIEGEVYTIKSFPKKRGPLTLPPAPKYRVKQLEHEAEASKKTKKAALSALGQERATAQIAAQKAQITNDELSKLKKLTKKLTTKKITKLKENNDAYQKEIVQLKNIRRQLTEEKKGAETAHKNAIQKLQAENKTIQDQINQLNAEKETLNNTELTQADQIEKLTNEKEALIQTLRKNVENANQDKAQIEKDKAELEKQIGIKEEAIKELNKQIKRIHAKKSALSEEVTHLQSAEEAAKTKITQLEKRIEQLTKEKDDKEALIQTHLQNLDKANQEKAQLENEKAALEEQIGIKEEAIKELNKQIRRINSEKTSLSEEVNHLNSLKRTSEDQISQLKKQITELGKGHLVSNQKELEYLKQQIEELNRDQTELENQKKSKEDRIIELDRELKHLKQQSATQLQSQKEKYLSDILNLQQTLAGKEETISSLTANIQQLRQEKAHLEQRIFESEKQNSQLTRKLASRREKYQQKMAQLQKEKGELEREIQVLNQDFLKIQEDKERELTLCKTELAKVQEQIRSVSEDDPGVIAYNCICSIMTLFDSIFEENISTDISSAAQKVNEQTILIKASLGKDRVYKEIAEYYDAVFEFWNNLNKVLIANPVDEPLKTALQEAANVIDSIIFNITPDAFIDEEEIPLPIQQAPEHQQANSSPTRAASSVPPSAPPLPPPPAPSIKIKTSASTSSSSQGVAPNGRGDILAQIRSKKSAFNDRQKKLKEAIQSGASPLEIQKRKAEMGQAGVLLQAFAKKFANANSSGNESGHNDEEWDE